MKILNSKAQPGGRIPTQVPGLDTLSAGLCAGLRIGLMALLLVACAGPAPAPDSDGSSTAGYQGTPDGYYRVKKGDSLYAISFKFGLDWKQIAQWNEISSPYVIYPDQLLRVGSIATPSPGSGTAVNSSGVQTKAAPAPGSATRTLDTPQSSTTREYDPDATSEATAGDAAAVDSIAGTPDSPDAETATTVAAATDSSTPSKGSQEPAGVSYSIPAGDPDRWIWPTEGGIVSRFQANDPTRKGLDIGGKSGQKVIAAAPGQVVYSGSGLIGYGELIIIKHSDRMLSAYAHNQKRLVNEGEMVAAGSSIAEMGTNDRNQAILHFEIRVNGVPTDPLNFLPQR